MTLNIIDFVQISKRENTHKINIEISADGKMELKLSKQRIEFMLWNFEFQIIIDSIIKCPDKSVYKIAFRELTFAFFYLVRYPIVDDFREI
jgi:hypothetical protein